jgi:hypothetical protein
MISRASKHYPSNTFEAMREIVGEIACYQQATASLAM